MGIPRVLFFWQIIFQALLCVGVEFSPSLPTNGRLTRHRPTLTGVYRQTRWLF